MTSPTNWRLLEAAIVEIARAEGYELAEHPKSGDKIMVVPSDCTNKNGRADDCGGGSAEINLTTFAQALALRFPPTAVQERVS